jgi:hypothetical protein
MCKKLKNREQLAPTNNNNLIMVDDTMIKNVDKFRYRGSTSTENGRLDEDVET